MSIQNFDTKPAFGNKLNTLISPSQPIDSTEDLFGRDDELDRIEKALYASGRHIFIYGDRGVGKSSLAATAANNYQSSDANYLDVSCAPDATIGSLVANIAYQATSSSRIVKESEKNTLGSGLKYFKFESTKFKAPNNLHEEIISLNDAVEVLREISLIHSEQPVIVVDEFDRLEDDEVKTSFSDLVKHLGDKRIGIKFIFTGVGDSLDRLLGSHKSAIRQFETIELPKLSWEARWEILIRAAKAFGIDVPKNIYYRVAAISDGYPYYVHLMTEKILWRAFEDQKLVDKISWDHYHLGLNDAIHSISAELKRPYEMAINQRTEDYEEVLWSTADSEWLQRYLKDMYTSYLHIMKSVNNKEPLKYETYSSRIRNLKSTSCGEILLSERRRGLYSYKEKMLRGFVRMQADSHGIELAGEAVAEAPKQIAHRTVKTSTGYGQSRIPREVNMGRRRRLKKKSKG